MPKYRLLLLVFPILSGLLRATDTSATSKITRSENVFPSAFFLEIPAAEINTNSAAVIVLTSSKLKKRKKKKKRLWSFSVGSSEDEVKWKD